MLVYLALLYDYSASRIGVSVISLTRSVLSARTPRSRVVAILSNSSSCNCLVDSVLKSGCAGTIFVFPSINVSSSVVLVTRASSPRSTCSTVRDCQLRHCRTCVNCTPVRTRGVSGNFISYYAKCTVLTIFSSVRAIRRL